MKITTKGRYAIKVMLNLGKKPKDKLTSLKKIADEENISLKYLEKIMLNLNKQDFFISSRGTDGGYKLKHDLDYYKIGDILKAAEESMSAVSCVSDEFSCPIKNSCPTYPIWKDLNDVINNHLNSKTLKDYLERSI